MLQTPGRHRPSPDPAPSTATSTIVEGMRFEGGVTGDADLVLDGRVKGDIRVSRVVVGPSAVVEGSIRAQQVEVRGRVLGSIDAQAVRLYGSAHVEGDIHHGHLSIEGGAYFEGRCQPLRKASKPAEAGAAPAPKPTGVTPFPPPAEAREASTRPNGVTAG